MKKTLITGANGFVGSALNSRLETTKKFRVLQATRVEVGSDKLIIDFSVDFNVKSELHCVETIIHCAARVHVMNDTSSNPIDVFREVNTHGTLNLARQAAEAGVSRFIFISSIKVNGESTELGKHFTADDNFIPTDPYGLSKYEAEIGLRNIAKETGMEVVIIRPPLVYGPGVKANFASMMKWVNTGIPMPLGGIIKNKRSLVALDNLVDLIITCIDHPKAANQTFLVSDDEDVSTSGLLQNMATALSIKSRLVAIPVSWFNLASQLIGKPEISQRLCGSLQVDISKTMNLLNWQPPYSSTVSMKKTADDFLENLNKKK